MRHFDNPRLLALWMAASIAVHGVILLAVPAMRLVERTPPKPLNVTLEQVQPERVITAPEPPRPMPQKKVAPKRVQRDEIPRASPSPPTPAAPVRTAPAPVLTMPQADSIAAPSVAQPEAPARVSAAPEGPGRERQARAAQAAEKSAEGTPPSYVRKPEPVYPLSARRRGEAGTVIVRALVTRDGYPARVNIEKSSGYTALDTAALEAVKGSRFAPAREGGQAVEGWVDLPIEFKFRGGS
jgi:protein TonB